MRVALVKGDYELAGGPESLLATLIPELAKTDIDPVVIVLARNPGHRVVRLLTEGSAVQSTVIPWSGLAASPLAAFRLNKAVAAHGCALLHTNDMRCDLAAALGRPISRVPWIAHVHGWLGHTHAGPWKYYETLDRFLVKRADRVLVGSHAAKAEVETYGLAPVDVVNNSVPLPSLDRIASVNAALRSHMGIAQNSSVVGMVGRLHPGKGQDLLLHAVASLVRKGVVQTCVIVGDGGEKDRLTALSATLGISRHVHFTGFVENTRDLVAMMDIVVVPSRKESLPLTALEAMALGKPVVCARAGDLPIVLEDGRNGVLVEADDPPALAAAIAALISDEAYRATLARRARKRVEEAYSVSAMASRLRDIYHQTAAAVSA